MDLWDQHLTKMVFLISDPPKSSGRCPGANPALGARHSV